MGYRRPRSDRWSDMMGYHPMNTISNMGYHPMNTISNRMREAFTEAGEEKAVDFLSNVVDWINCCIRYGVPQFRTRYGGEPYDNMVLGVCWASGGACKSQWFKNVPPEDKRYMETHRDDYIYILEMYGGDVRKAHIKKDLGEEILEKTVGEKVNPKEPDINTRVYNAEKVLGITPYNFLEPDKWKAIEGLDFKTLASTDYGDTSIPTVVEWANGEVDSFGDLNKSLQNRDESIRMRNMRTGERVNPIRERRRIRIPPQVEDCMRDIWERSQDDEYRSAYEIKADLGGCGLDGYLDCNGILHIYYMGRHFLTDLTDPNFEIRIVP